MIELFGEKHKFAIQAKLEYLTDSGNPVGQICLWIGGDQIGDFDSSCDVLGYCQAGFDNLVKGLGTRNDPLLDGKSKEDVISFLQDAVLGDLRSFSEGDEIFEYRFQDFLLCPELGEDFEDEIVAVLDVNSFSRIIWLDRKSNTVKEIAVQQSEIRKASGEYSEWVNNFYPDDNLKK